LWSMIRTIPNRRAYRADEAMEKKEEGRGGIRCLARPGDCRVSWYVLIAEDGLG